jgi:hypothetical protein
MVEESIRKITKNNKHYRAALLESLNERKQLSKKNHEHRDAYLQKIVDDLKERDDSDYVTVKQL